MTKTNSLILQCLGTFLAFLGIWWWTGREYRKTHPVKTEWKQIENPVPVKVYQGKWHKVGYKEGYLEVIGK